MPRTRLNQLVVAGNFSTDRPINCFRDKFNFWGNTIQVWQGGYSCTLAHNIRKLLYENPFNLVLEANFYLKFGQEFRYLTATAFNLHFSVRLPNIDRKIVLFDVLPQIEKTTGWDKLQVKLEGQFNPITLSEAQRREQCGYNSFCSIKLNLFQATCVQIQLNTRCLYASVTVICGKFNDEVRALLNLLDTIKYGSRQSTLSLAA